MVLHFNATKDSRKAMVQAIEKELGVKAKYLGVGARESSLQTEGQALDLRISSDMTGDQMESSW